MWRLSNALFALLIILFYLIWVWSLCCYYWLCSSSLYFIILISFLYHFLCLYCSNYNTLLTCLLAWICSYICDRLFSFFFLLLYIFWRIDSCWIGSYICDRLFSFFFLLLLLIWRIDCCLRCSEWHSFYWCFRLILFFKVIFFISCILRRIILWIWILFSFLSILLFCFQSFQIILSW